MRNIVGTHVSGDDFCGRAHELKRCKAIAEDSNDILLLSPRRVGKSSLSAELGRVLYEEGWIYIRCDVQSAKSERDFLALIKAAIQESKCIDPKKLKKGLKNLISEIEKIELSATKVSIEKNSAAPDFDWWSASTETAQFLEKLAQLPLNTFFVLDELPIFLRHLQAQENGPERVATIFDWLNSVRENKTNTGFSWFLCGSIGLDSLAEQLGIPEKIQKFSLQHLGPMPKEEAEHLLERLRINPETFTEDKAWIDHILNKIGWLIPSYIQIIYSALQDIPLDERSENFPSVEDVDRAYDAVTGKHYTSEFSHWDRRLGDAFIEPELIIVAKTILNFLCQHSEGTDKENIKVSVLSEHPRFNTELFDHQYSQTLKLLESDGYIHIDTPRVAFRSPVLRDYWKNKTL